jgi:Cu+-exporting ATPase
LESFKKIEQVVFDKTGTLTTGKFIIASYHTSIDDNEFKQIVFSIEKYSSHPMAKAICNEWITKEPFKWRKIEELKGLGIRAEDEQGNVYEAGSLHMLPQQAEIDAHNIYIVKNKMLLGWIDLKDEIRPEAKEVINWLHKQKIKTILLSGDRKENCIPVAAALNIDHVMAEQLPADKLRVIAELSSKSPTAMVGEGINDAPALAKATLGISLSEASQIAMQNADVVLMSNGLKQLPLAMGLGKHTFRTIKQNLFWAFFYNIIAIPIAALGFLTPAIAALAMGFSDVILAINSIRLFVKKVF